MKKKVIMVMIIVILLILLVPIPMRLKDGGTVEYRALVYKISNVHKLNLNSDNGYDDGIIIEILGIEVLNTVNSNIKNNTSNSNTISSNIPNGVNIANEDQVGVPSDSIELNRNPANVTIEIDNNSVKAESVSIIITDNNEDYYGWGVEFRVQQKIDGEWKDLKYISYNLSWIDIAYELGEDKQLTQKLDIEKYYGKLSNGIYRIVKPVYDNEYIDIYSNEFEIK